MIGPLTFLDAGLLTLAFISGLLAMYRGLSREVLSILSWVAGAAFGVWLYNSQPGLGIDIGKQTGLPSQVAQIAVAAIAGLIVLIVVELITSRMSDAVLDSQVGMIDRILGFLFGAVRGFLIVVIFYAGLLFFVPDLDKRYEWVGNSVSLPHVRSTAATLSGFVNDNILPHLGAPKDEKKAPEG
jgi:membrane protein required for colicin V production